MGVTPYYVDQYLDEIWHIAGLIRSGWYSTWQFAQGAVGNTFYNTVLAIEELWIEIEILTDNIYYDLLNRINSIQGVSKGYVDGQISILRSYVNSQINAAKSYAASLVDGVYNYVDSEISYIYQDINAIVGNIYFDLDAGIDEAKSYAANLVTGVYNYVDNLETQIYSDLWAVVDDIYIDMAAVDGATRGYVDSQIDLVRAELSIEIDTLEGLMQVLTSDLYTAFDALKLEIDQELELRFQSVYATISDRVTQLTGIISGVQNTLSEQIADEVDALENKIKVAKEELNATLLSYQLTLSGDIQAVKDDLEAQFAVVSVLATFTYQYASFGLELPEIGFLNMLLRSDEQFARFKDYLQLFVARILEKG